MANREASTVARKPCPCGGGQVQIVLTYDDSDWGARDQNWHGTISCERCRPLYAFVGAGRGADVVRVEDKARCDGLRRDAAILRKRFLASVEVRAFLNGSQGRSTPCPLPPLVTAWPCSLSWRLPR